MEALGGRGAVLVRVFEPSWSLALPEFLGLIDLLRTSLSMVATPRGKAAVDPERERERLVIGLTVSGGC